MEFLKTFHNWQDIGEHPARTVIFAEGDPAEYLYVILSGEVELSMRGAVLEVEKTGGLIGEMALFESATRSSTAEKRRGFIGRIVAERSSGVHWKFGSGL